MEHLILIKDYKGITRKVDKRKITSVEVNHSNGEVSFKVGNRILRTKDSLASISERMSY